MDLLRVREGLICWNFEDERDIFRSSWSWFGALVGGVAAGFHVVVTDHHSLEPLDLCILTFPPLNIFIRCIIHQKPRPTLGVNGLFTAPCVDTRLIAEVTGLLIGVPSISIFAIL